MDLTMARAAITIDPGSCYLKAGYSGKLIPTMSIPNAVGYTERVRRELEHIDIFNTHTRNFQADPRRLDSGRMYSPVTRSHEIRPGYLKSFDLAQLSKFAEKKHIVRPMFGGKLLDEGAFLDVCRFVVDRLRGRSEVPIFLAVPPTSTPRDVFKMVDMLIMGGLTPCVGLMYSAPLTLIAAGRTTGLAVEAGYSMSCVSPIYDGTVAKKRMAWSSTSSGMGLESLLYEYARRDIEHQIDLPHTRTELAKIFGGQNRDSYYNFMYQEWTRDLVRQFSFKSRELSQPSDIILEVPRFPDGSPIENEKVSEISLPFMDEVIAPSYSLSLYPEYFRSFTKPSEPLSFASIFNFTPLLKESLCPMNDTSVRTLIGNQTGCVVPSGGLMESVTPLSSSQTTLRISIESLFPSLKSKMASPVRPFCSLSNAACAGGCIISSLASSSVLLVTGRELAEYGERIVIERLE